MCGSQLNLKIEKKNNREQITKTLEIILFFSSKFRYVIVLYV